MKMIRNMYDEIKFKEDDDDSNVRKIKRRLIIKWE